MKRVRVRLSEAGCLTGVARRFRFKMVALQDQVHGADVGEDMPPTTALHSGRNRGTLWSRALAFGSRILGRYQRRRLHATDNCAFCLSPRLPPML